MCGWCWIRTWLMLAGNAFDTSIETNVMIESGELAGRILEYLKTIKIDNSIDDFLNKDGMSVVVSRQFLENSGIGPRLVKLQAERSFDLYLYLLWKFKGDSKGRVMFFYDEAAKYLGIYEGWEALGGMNSGSRRNISSWVGGRNCR